jgi:outer membrane protein
MGSPDLPDFSVVDIGDGPEGPSPAELPSLEAAVGSALENRPDLKSYNVSLASAEAAVSLARLDNAPKLDLSGSFGWGSTDFWGNDSWRAGMTLSFPLYDGGLGREKLLEARANLEGAEARLESYRQQVLKDVTNAWLAASDFTETTAAAAEGLRMASENLEIATGRYKTGVGSPLEVSDATKNFAEAKAAWFGAIYDGMTARAALEKAMGVIR